MVRPVDVAHAGVVPPVVRGQPAGLGGDLGAQHLIAHHDGAHLDGLGDRRLQDRGRVRQSVPAGSVNGVQVRSGSDCSYNDWKLGATKEMSGLTWGAAYYGTDAKGLSLIHI